VVPAAEAPAQVEAAPPAYAPAAAQEVAPQQYPPQYPPQQYAPQYPAAQYPPQYPYGAYAPPAPAPQCPAAAQCIGELQASLDGANALDDRLLQLQASCLSLTNMVKCMCGGCQNVVESDESFKDAHETYCSPAMLAQFRLAGDYCSDFATGFCGVEVDQHFCDNFAVPPVLGSPQWLAQHQVVDPGTAAAAAGVDLFSNQLPAYSQKIADSLSKYLAASASAMSAKARLTNAVLSEMQAIQPHGTPAPGEAAAVNGTETAHSWYCFGVLC